MYQWGLGDSWLSVHGGERSTENRGHVAGESPPSVQASLELLGARRLGSETFSATFPTGATYTVQQSNKESIVTVVVDNTII